MIEVVHTNADQPWHVRIQSGDPDGDAGNNRTLVISENLSNQEDAFADIIAIAHEFGIGSPLITTTDLGSGQSGYVLLDANAIVSVVQIVDERTEGEDE